MAARHTREMVDRMTRVAEEFGEPIEDILRIWHHEQHVPVRQIAGALDMPLSTVRQWLGAHAGADSAAKSTQKKKGGRPRYPENAWAWEEVNVRGRPLAVVYPEWYSRAGDRAAALTDPYDSFRQATKPRKKRKQVE